MLADNIKQLIMDQEYHKRSSNKMNVTKNNENTDDAINWDYIPSACQATGFFFRRQ